MFRLEELWDYSGWRGMAPSSTQSQWNNTLITVINNVSAKIHKSTLKGGANMLLVPQKFRELFEGLSYYNEDNSTLGGRYKVIFCVDEDNTIIVRYDGKYGVNESDSHNIVESRNIKVMGVPSYMNKNTHSSEYKPKNKEYDEMYLLIGAGES